MARIFQAGKDPVGCQGIWLLSLYQFPVGFFIEFYLIKLWWKVLLISMKRWLFGFLAFFFPSKETNDKEEECLVVYGILFQALECGS